MAQYLPVLLVSVSAVSSNPAPDDSSLDIQAIGQVDYLSHDWQEEDVAKSWRNMTRRKDSIQNGARLENASWRTWWKQRNNLPTVSPETLNWLKDSDVTWLYGPLHTAADWVPPPRHSPEPDCATSSPTSPSLHPSDSTLPSNPSWSLKPILKHRSISELLSISLPSSPGSDPMELEESSSPPTKSDVAYKRPKLTHTKSDSNMHQNNPFRRDSPPLPLSSIAEETPIVQRGRHITFNTFVQQCIAIEEPKSTPGDNEYCDDDEESDEESDDDVLEIRPRHHLDRPVPPSPAASCPLPQFPSPEREPQREREHVTIAPIAPTMLKTSTSPSPVSSWNLWPDDLDEDDDPPLTGRHTHSAPSVNLVYVPPQGSVYARREEPLSPPAEPIDIFPENPAPTPVSAPIPVPAPAPVSGALPSSLLELPSRGRLVSREQEQERGRSRSRSSASAEGSVSPRSGTPFGVPGSGSRGHDRERSRSRSLSLSPEERERERRRRAREKEGEGEMRARKSVAAPVPVPVSAPVPVQVEETAMLAGIVSSTKGYLGSLWRSSERVVDAAASASTASAR